MGTRSWRAWIKIFPRYPPRNDCTTARLWPTLRCRAPNTLTFFSSGRAALYSYRIEEYPHVTSTIMMLNRKDAELNDLIRTARDLVRDALRPDLDLDAFLAEVLRRTHDLAPFDVGLLFLREGERVRVRAADEAHRGDEGMSFPVADCVSGQSMLRRAPIFIPDLAEMPPELRRVYKPSRSSTQLMRSELVVPLLIGEEAIGALNIESAEPHAFTPEQIEILRLLADHAALAIELARSRQEAAALSAISLQLARETELADIVRTVLERALGLVGGRFGQILLSEGADLVVHYTTNTPPRDIGLRFAVHGSVSGLAVVARRPVVVPDVSQPEYFVVVPPAEGPRRAPDPSVLRDSALSTRAGAREGTRRARSWRYRSGPATARPSPAFSMRKHRARTASPMCSGRP